MDYKEMAEFVKETLEMPEGLGFWAIMRNAENEFEAHPWALLKEIHEGFSIVASSEQFQGMDLLEIEIEMECRIA